MNKKSVLFLGKYSFLSNKGGIETFSKFFFRYLNYNIIGIFFNKENKCLIYKKRRIVLIKPIFNFLGAPLSLLPFNFLFKSKPKILHLNCPNPFTEFQLLLYFLVRGKKEKFLITYHADAPHYTIFHQIFDFLRLSWLLPLLYISNRIVLTSKEYLLGSFAPRMFRKKVKIIPLGIDFSELKKTKRVRLNLKNKKVVLFVGRLYKYKGLEYLIKHLKEVSKEIPQAVLVIVGKGPLFFKLKDLAKRLGIKDKVIFTGQISEEERNYLYKICNVFVLPSINKGEAFGLAMIEAMYFGKPIISTRIKGSGVTFVNKHKITGLVVEPKNEKELANAIITLLKDEKLRKKLGKNARERCLKLFDARKMVKEYEKIYLQLMS
ncbi:MAG: glycosyltransferase [Candidatus Aenigmarchaeota archaeon]|nr:glycosyltransferase [Candidatus Aenigmarchaeota archaeon]